MGNSPVCGHCQAPNRATASYCARCGQSLKGSPRQAVGTSPSGEQWRKCDNAADLKYRWCSAWGGSPLLGTENLAITLVNQGRTLRDLTVEIRGVDRNAAQLFALRQEIERLDSGQEATFELPSYEISDETRDVTLSLISATRT
jgi:hypothetical protein